MKVLVADNGGKPDKTARKIKKVSAVTPDPLILTIQNAVSQLSTANEQTGKLVDNVILQLSRDIPTPIIQMDAPVITIPPYPEVEPPRKWRVTVTSRDAKGLIHITDVERIE